MVSVEKGRQVRLLCPWAKHLTRLSLYLWMVILVVTGGSLSRRPKRSLRCLLVEVPWQINVYLNLMPFYPTWCCKKFYWCHTHWLYSNLSIWISHFFIASIDDRKFNACTSFVEGLEFKSLGGQI